MGGEPIEGIGDGAGPGVLDRIGVALGLLAGLRPHDLRAANSFTKRAYPTSSLPVRILKFIGWALGQMLGSIPDALTTVRFDGPISRTSIWLSSENPLANHPWATDPRASLPEEVDVAVIGAGFTGAACAYHWSKQTGGTMAVLEMNEASSGASGRNEGIVVMGRYFAYTKKTVLDHFNRKRKDLTPEERDSLASKFASAYVKSAYNNADMIEETVKKEGFDCEYARIGWVQGRDDDEDPTLDETVRLGEEAGFDDWTTMEPAEVLELTGMKLDSTAGFSKRAATWHPARWVWSLLTAALKAEHVKLFTNTKVLKVEDRPEHYAVHTSRGTVRARFVINATESYTALLHPQLRGVLYPIQTQCAFAEGGPEGMKPEVGLQSGTGFFGRVIGGIIFGSDGTRISYRKAGRNSPSRFISKYLIGQMQLLFGRSRTRVTREWSCTAGFTDDEFPIVGLLDGKRQYIVAGMCGSGSGVHFNGARHVVQQILGLDGPNDYPAEFFAPTRVLDPDNHPWPSVDE